MNYYNEFDPKVALWLRWLIKKGLIPDGEVDVRSIRDVRASDLKGYSQHHFFAGIGGWSLALGNAGWPIDRGVWTGSCPCQPFSQAGKKQGFDDERHLWPVFRDLIEEFRPSDIFGEQVASATDWLRLVRSDLENLGYAVGAMPVEAASAGAYHLRDRYFFVANSDNAGSQGRSLLRERADQWVAGEDGVADTEGQRGNGREDTTGSQGWLGIEADGNMGKPNGEGWKPGKLSTAPAGHGSAVVSTGSDLQWVAGADGKARRIKSGVRLLADGFPCRVGLLRGFGNAIDPRPAEAFIRASMQ